MNNLTVNPFPEYLHNIISTQCAFVLNSPKKHLIKTKQVRENRNKNISQAKLSHAQNKRKEEPARQSQQKPFTHKY